jgi:hypothetical protein
MTEINQTINRCTASSSDLDGIGGRRTRAFTKELIDELDAKTLWEEYGIDADILVYFHFIERYWDLLTHFTKAIYL